MVQEKLDEVPDGESDHEGCTEDVQDADNEQPAL